MSNTKFARDLAEEPKFALNWIDNKTYERKESYESQPPAPKNNTEIIHEFLKASRREVTGPKFDIQKPLIEESESRSQSEESFPQIKKLTSLERRKTPNAEFGDRLEAPSAAKMKFKKSSTSLKVPTEVRFSLNFYRILKSRKSQRI